MGSAISSKARFLPVVLVPSLRHFGRSQKVRHPIPTQSSALTVKSDDFWYNNQRITWSCQPIHERMLIIQVIEELKHYTNLNFHYVPNMADADIKIGIIPDVNAGGKSTVGRSATIGHTPYTMMLAEDSPLYLIRHEFFHTLGFLHEHQSPRRPFSIDTEEAIKSLKVSAEFVKDEIEPQYSLEDVGICTRYDVTSISHYKLKPPVMVPNPGQLLPVSDQNLVFSNLDKAVLVLMYPRTQPHDAAPKWTVEHALSVVGVPKVFHPVIIGDRSADGIRKRFVKWNKTNHSLHCSIM